VADNRTENAHPQIEAGDVEQAPVAGRSTPWWRRRRATVAAGLVVVLAAGGVWAVHDRTDTVAQIAELEQQLAAEAADAAVAEELQAELEELRTRRSAEVADEQATRPDTLPDAVYGTIQAGELALPIVDQVTATDGLVVASSTAGVTEVLSAPGVAAQVYAVRLTPSGNRPGQNFFTASDGPFAAYQGTAMADFTSTTPRIVADADGIERKVEYYDTEITTPDGSVWRVVDVVREGDGRSASTWLPDLLADPGLLFLYGVGADGADPASPPVVAIAEQQLA
jgi:hypothetical protein